MRPAVALLSHAQPLCTRRCVTAPLLRRPRASARAMRRQHSHSSEMCIDEERGGADENAPSHATARPPHPPGEPFLRQRAPSPPVADASGWRRAPVDATTDEFGRAPPYGPSCDVQRELARRTHPHAHWPAVAADDKIDPVFGDDLWVETRVRGSWLLGLLALQSLSSFVLEANEGLIREHLVITLFLTMLVGAGGNSGAQSAVFVIRGLATGQFPATADSFKRVVKQQLRVGVLLGTALAIGGFARVYLTEGVPVDAFAIATALFAIVNASVLAGASLPFLLAWRGVDPAHAGTTVQVVMDVAGVGITCAVCRVLLAGGAATEGAAAVAKHAITAAAEAAAAAGGAG